MCSIVEEEPRDQIDLSIFSGNLRRDERDNARDCWKLSDGNNFRVRSRSFCFDKSKVLIVSFANILCFLVEIFFILPWALPCRFLLVSIPWILLQ